MTQAAIVVTPQDQLTRFVGKNWKSAAGSILMIGAAIAVNRHWITPELASQLNEIGAGLLGFGIAHKIERFIAVAQSVVSVPAVPVVPVVPVAPSAEEQSNGN